MEVGPVDANVLLIGETGTGKEVVARCLHDLSCRRTGPYVPLNCGAIPASLAESELFGHEPGAFTSASHRRIGSLEQAGGGTLFLDEVMAMPLDVQAKLLRAIQEREFSRLGSSDVLQADFRLVAAVNREPQQAIDMDLLREDLYYRFNTVEIRLPPLRERKEDIPMLFVLFTEQAAEAYQREMVYPDADTMAMLLLHDWPGNIRELKNVATRFVLSTLHPRERLTSLLGHGKERAEENTSDVSMSGGVGLQEQVRIFERSLLQDALRRHSGHVQAVLEELKLARRTFNEKMNRYGLHRSADPVRPIGDNPLTK